MLGERDAPAAQQAAQQVNEGPARGLLIHMYQAHLDHDVGLQYTMTAQAQETDKAIRIDR